MILLQYLLSAEWASSTKYAVILIHDKLKQGPFAKFVVGTLWRCGDGLFFEVPPLASDALLTTLHPLLENVLQTVDHFEISCLEATFS
jgi:hypothetical protein